MSFPTYQSGFGGVDKEAVPSASDGQWFMRTHAVQPNVRDVGSVVLLDNGDMWMSGWGKRYFPNNVFFGGYGQWIGKVSPEGGIQYSGDHWATDSANNGTYGANGYALDEWFLPRQRIPSRSTENQITTPLLTDGTFIYFMSYPVNDGGASTADGLRWWKLDPETGYATWIAGAEGDYFYNDPTADSHIGRQAVLGQMWAWTIDENYIYWTQKTPSSLGDGLVIRRMNLNGSYPVTTLPGLDSSPSWWSAESDEEVINPSTGIPQRFNSDVWLKEHVDSRGWGGAMVVRNGWIYFANGPSLRRIPVGGGSVQTYLWGFSWDESTLNTHKRDNLLDFSETPYGSGANGYPYAAQLGVPDLEGLDVTAGGTVVDSKFLFVTGAFTQYVSYFDLDEMDTKYATSGPRRVNRTSPEHRTVVNGTIFAEQGTSYAASFGSFIPEQAWRDASASPVFWYVGDFPLTSNAKALGWENRAVLVHTAPTITYRGGLTGVVSLIEPMIDGHVYKLTLSFEGNLLKGYAAARKIEHPSAPEEVILG